MLGPYFSDANIRNTFAHPTHLLSALLHHQPLPLRFTYLSARCLQSSFRLIYARRNQGFFLLLRHIVIFLSFAYTKKNPWSLKFTQKHKHPLTVTLDVYKENCYSEQVLRAVTLRSSLLIAAAVLTFLPNSYRRQSSFCRFCGDVEEAVQHLKITAV